MAQAQTRTGDDERLGDALDRLLAALGDIAEVGVDQPPEAVARRVVATIYLGDDSLRAVRWARSFLAALEAGS